MTPREMAYKALLAALQEKAYLTETLQNASKKDFHLAKEIATGSLRMRLALDYLAKSCANRPKLTLKLKERALLHTALYQYFYMSRIPLYAIVDETVSLAKRYCHASFAKFLNAILRNLEKMALSLPQGDDVEALSIRTSFPPYFVERLCQNYGLEVTKQILEALNRPSQNMARIRNAAAFKQFDPVSTNPLVVRVIDSDQIPFLALSDELYIQNVTSAFLMSHLGAGIASNPNSILDLCASPGGKLLAAHDLFPQAQLFANDVSDEKMQRLKQNCSKYHLNANLSCCPGQDYPEGNFDLIILDVPCSNSGVFHKRPEARWRLSEEQLNKLEKTQLQLLQRARQLVSQKGEVWFLTCSILKRENEQLLKRACQDYGFQMRGELTILPNLEGWEGGFGAALVTQ